MAAVECLNFAEGVESCASDTVAQRIEPLSDPRWDVFLQRHPRASVFHSSAWLEALSRTYGYKAFAYTTSPAGGMLDNAIVFCRVESWLTGRRLVSVPFSDHCEPLVDRYEDWRAVTAAVQLESRREAWRYIELRPLQPLAIDTYLHRITIPYSFHQLDLQPDIQAVLQNFHKSSIQRKIHRAEREGLRYHEGRDQMLLGNFYKLFAATRRRHKLPPQPKAWFRNLIDCFGPQLKIRVAYKDNRAVAAILTIRYKDTLTYKYGGSDSRYNKLGGMQFLFWTAIQEAKSSGLRRVDFGRTDADQQGLITFKNRWGAAQSKLTYYRYSASGNPTHLFEPAAKWKSKMARYVIGKLPSSILPVVGQMLYRHVG
jgi:CelD/BcsL family acetyltransferase involved in cellulose biosynthesis